MENLDKKYHESVQESVDRLKYSEFNHQRSLNTLRNNLDQISTQLKSSNME